MKRWLIEGEWSGYTDGQRKVVHRKVIQGRPKFRIAIERLRCITYTDGTRLLLTVRDCKPREKVVEINGYGSLIEDCVRHNVNSVANLPDDR